MRTKSLWIIAVCIAAAGCGAPFTEESAEPACDCEVIILWPGEPAYPEPEDVVVPQALRRSAPDAGRSK